MLFYILNFLRTRPLWPVCCYLADLLWPGCHWYGVYYNLVWSCIPVMLGFTSAQAWSGQWW